jgi:phosphoribosyl 1,2-cyclic phosphodiesterase
MAAFVKFWGARGSIPTPASWTRVYGGNTACVEVRFDDTIFICDAGSGIRELGKDLMTRRPRPTELHLLITHTHWDHIQGFPFFVPAYSPKNQIRVYGISSANDDRHRLLSGQMASEYFPVSFHDLGAQIACDHLNGGAREIEGVRVRSFPLNHPGGSCGFVFEKAGIKIVYATDNELELAPGDRFPDSAHEGGLRRVPAGLIEIARGADLLITDGQYDDKQYASRKGWGHSSCFSVTDLAIQAEVKNLALFHHDPESTDAQIEDKVHSCCQRAARHEAPLVIFAAREGVELKFDH